jgi:hypothetical protein
MTVWARRDGLHHDAQVTRTPASGVATQDPILREVRGRVDSRRELHVHDRDEMREIMVFVMPCTDEPVCATGSCIVLFVLY